MTPELWPVWCPAMAGSRSSTCTDRPGWRASSSRATARPRMPAPTTATSYSPAAALIRTSENTGRCRSRRWAELERSRRSSLPRSSPARAQITWFADDYPRVSARASTRIMLTSYGYNDSGGGTIVPRALARELTVRGWDVTVFHAAVAPLAAAAARHREHRRMSVGLARGGARGLAGVQAPARHQRQG